ncbi:tetratricopeptide repeat protein [Streptomyces sp. NPDC052196]|uniref:tetratricopeptide repeat protein n=1 Tax=Streptomyces sp. NPDC052196 TaxID=3156691 RepID=UPI0034399E23
MSGAAITKAEVSARDTGDAHAADGGAAVTGYRGPASDVADLPSSVEVSHTGSAVAIGPGATAISGSLTVLQRGPQEPASWPHQVGTVPPRAQMFQHRVEADRLRTAVQSGGMAAASCQLLTGMGGVGKTQLAADYAHTAWRDGAVDVLVWVSAATRSAVVNAYAQAGVELCRADPHDPDRAANTLLAWLAFKPGAAPCRWLMVLDDVADPADLRGLWPPESPLGQTLVTTRRRDAALTGAGRRLVEVGLFTPAEAVLYLAGTLAAHDRTESDDQLSALAADLGRLPLALSQAAAYLIDAYITISEYRALLADRATALAESAPDALPDDQRHTTAAALTLSVDRADALRPRGLGRSMLRLVAFLDPNGIPQAALTSTSSRTYLTAHRNTSTAVGAETLLSVSESDAAAALRALHRLHLIEHTPDTPGQSVRIHQLTQRAVRDTLTRDECHALARTAASALLSVWPDLERDIGFAQTLRANATSLASHSQDALLQPDAHDVLHRAGRSISEAGQVIAARDYFHHLAVQAQHHLGPDHPTTLAFRHRLAFEQGMVGDAAGAVTALAALLADRQRVLAPDHPDIHATRHSLASWQGEAGDAAGAVTAFAALLADRQRVLGPDHPQTLGTRHTHAQWQGDAGNAAGAVTAFAALLADRQRALGPDHPHTLGTRQDLALWRGEAGDAAGAVTALDALLADQQRVLGPDDPDTLATRHSLASWQGEAGDAAGAVTALAALLADRQRVLGPDHLHTLATRHNLAHWQGKTGDAAGAVTALAALLADRQRALGPDHPHTLATRRDLAHWQGKVEDATGAATADQ